MLTKAVTKANHRGLRLVSNAEGCKDRSGPLGPTETGPSYQRK